MTMINSGLKGLILDQKIKVLDVETHMLQNTIYLIW